MKICVLGLDCAAPEVVFGDPGLTNMRALMSRGIFGRLESVIPPITVPAWMCMATGQDPGSLGVYGFRNRADHSYGGLAFVNSQSIREPAIWDYLGALGKQSILLAVPPGYPPRQINGVSVGCFLTPNPRKDTFTHPPELKAELFKLVGDYPVDVEGFRTHDKERLRREIFEMSRKQWTVARWLLRERPWDYFQFVDIGTDRIHHAFWDCFDTTHVKYRPGNPYEGVIPEYYHWLDGQIGEALDLVGPDTIVLVASDHGAQRLDGGFAINEWLVSQDLLALHESPATATPFDQLRVDWSRTKVWSEGGYYARVFLNLRGREPQGVIPSEDFEAFRNDLKTRLEALTDDKGRPLHSLVFKPEEIYRNVRNVAPDLIVHFGGLYWRSIGSVGHGRFHLQENDTGPDGCNHAQFGMFILAAPNCPLRGEFTGARIIDIAPTLLDLAGHDVPVAMQGRSLLSVR